MSDPALDVVEFVLTTHLYSENRDLDENDLPPRFRRVFWSADAAEDAPGGVERPLKATDASTRTATGVERPWDAVSDLLFTQHTEFSGEITLTQPEMGLEWYRDHADDDRIASNPTLVAALSAADGLEAPVSHEEAREDVRPIQADRVWIDALLEEYFDEDEDGEMLDLVNVRAPEEIETTLADLVLTGDQEEEIQKIVKAIEHREYLASIGLREIGKLLFVGPPGTGKTTVSRALAHQLGIPLVEVKMSMITSQYLGETAKNVEKTFEVAKRLSPCILFIDEFDSVAKTRRSDEHAALKRAVNTLLKSIDEVSLVRDEVLLIGATNHPDQLDAAAWRRFDEIVNFPKPDRDMRADILRVVTREMQIADFDPAEVADRTSGLTGSDLRMVLREAVLGALTEDRMTITQADVMEAVADFEERDNLKNMDMIDGEGAEVLGQTDDSGADHGGGHDHGEGDAHDHGESDAHAHGHPQD
ncbi:ATP-binding protein [Halorubrum halodurans]|uniref:AAA family ATPase n=1 Tax=Halorubrum halodurans TaxID=1383851 RepID=A0A256IDC5_9EURY|nr:ATP-binding protein [Halorubrum halodurans]OYR54531.1 AAA family ATPase [Halorubrum halodurans]